MIATYYQDSQTPPTTDMASTLVILAAVIAVVSSATHPALRDGWPQVAPAAARPVWLRNPAGISTVQPENPMPSFAGGPSRAQLVHVFDEATDDVFSPVPAAFPSSGQPTGVRIINSADELYTGSPAEEEASANANLNAPTTVFTLAPRASGFSNAPSPVAFAPPATVYLVNNPQTGEAHLIRAAYPAQTANFAATPASHSIIPLTSAANLGRSPSTFVISQAPIGAALNAVPTLAAAPSSRAAGHEEYFAESPMTWADIACARGFCGAQPVSHASFRGVAPANHLNAQYPGALVWDATPAISPRFSHAGAAQLIPVSAPGYGPVSLVQAAPASPLAFSSGIVQPLS